MDSTSPFTISPEHINQVLGILILGVFITAVVALDQYFSYESRKYRHIRRLLALAKAAASPAHISQDTKEQLAIAQQDFYRAKTLRETKPPRPATLRQTMEYCEMQCQFVLDQVCAELKERAELEHTAELHADHGLPDQQIGQQQSGQKQNRQQRKHKRRKTKQQNNRSRMYW